MGRRKESRLSGEDLLRYFERAIDWWIDNDEIVNVATLSKRYNQVSQPVLREMLYERGLLRSEADVALLKRRRRRLEYTQSKKGKPLC